MEPRSMRIFAFLTAQNYELNARGNLWCGILEFWAVFVMCLIHSWLRRLRFHSENNRNAKGPLLHSKRTPFAHQNEPFCTPNVVVLQSRQSPLQRKSSRLAYVNGNFSSRKVPFCDKNKAISTPSTHKNPASKLQNQIFICNTFLLP